MTTLIFDLETNGFLEQMDRIHCLVIRDAETGEVWSLHGSSIDTGIAMLMSADVVVGHNIIAFDLPAINKIYPWFSLKPGAIIHDTMILGRLFWPDIKFNDDSRRERDRHFALPPKLRGSYKLEAFGYRLGILKSEYDGGWEQWSQTMQHYCEQDVEVTRVLYEKALVRWGNLPDWMAARSVAIPGNYTPYSDECILLEHRVQEIVSRQVRYGFAFNEGAANELYMALSARREELRRELSTTFPPFYRAKGKAKTPKADNNRYGYWKNAPFQPVQLVDFNPANNHHIIDRLKKVRGWEPAEFTETGQPKVDDSIISRLPYPEAPLISEYLMVQKRISALAEGDEAWLTRVTNGRIHGGVVTLGAVTRRMTHLNPNIAGVPSTKVPYGKACRALFMASTCMILVGCDADALELRLLAGYMAPYDDGAYIETVLRGRKDEGTDMHSVNARALGLDPKQEYPVDGMMISGRDIAKTWFYAFIYGGGSEKLGWILGKRGDPSNPDHFALNRYGEKEDKVASRAGARSKKDFMTNLPALGQLVEAVKLKSKQVGFLRALDGGKLVCRKPHAALNTLLQSAGAIVMKKALVLLDDTLRSQGLTPGEDYEFVANVHDELQMDVKPQHVDMVKQFAEDAIRLAGEAYKFRCPLKGNAAAGPNWAETH